MKHLNHTKLLCEYYRQSPNLCEKWKKPLICAGILGTTDSTEKSISCISDSGVGQLLDGLGEETVEGTSANVTPPSSGRR